jgi:hypothetical protein
MKQVMMMVKCQLMIIDAMTRISPTSCHDANSGVADEAYSECGLVKSVPWCLRQKNQGSSKRDVQAMIGWHGHTDFEYCQRFDDLEV